MHEYIKREPGYAGGFVFKIKHLGDGLEGTIITSEIFEYDRRIFQNPRIKPAPFKK
jgi:hypothetical protein